MEGFQIDRLKERKLVEETAVPIDESFCVPHHPKLSVPSQPSVQAQPYHVVKGKISETFDILKELRYRDILLYITKQKK